MSDDTGSQHLQDAGGQDLRGCFVEGTLVPGKKGGAASGKPSVGKGTKIMGIADRHGLPVALRTERASPAEVKLVERTLEEQIVPDVPERSIEDKAYDGDGLER